MCVFCGLLSSCVKPSVQDIFIKSTDAPDGVYVFELDLSDSLSVYDILIYSRTDAAPRALKRIPPIKLSVEWFAPAAADTVAGEQVQSRSRSLVPALTDTVALAAVKHGYVIQPYRTGVNPSVRGLWSLRMSVLNVPESFRGIGIICERKDGTR